jgi:hypothetical protein
VTTCERDPLYGGEIANSRPCTLRMRTPPPKAEKSAADRMLLLKSAQCNETADDESA